MRKGTYDARQLDVNARYLAIKAFIVCCFYSDDYINYIPINGIWSNELTVVFLSSLYFSAIFITLFSFQNAETNLASYYILFCYWKPILLNFLLETFHILLYLFFIYLFSLFKIFCILLDFIKLLFTCWRPIFKKFGYLLNFFKKN